MSQAPDPLEELSRQLTTFIGTLEAESTALASADIDALASILAEKTQLAGAAARAWNETMSWLRSQSTGQLNEGLEVPSEIQPRWQQIIVLAHRAEALNQRNGELIESQLQRTRGAIEILQAAARPLPLYGADGHMLDPSGRGHTLDKV